MNPLEARHLVVQGAGGGVVLLSGAVEAGCPLLPRCIGHLLDQHPRHASAACRLVDEKVLEVATVFHPERRWNR